MLQSEKGLKTMYACINMNIGAIGGALSDSKMESSPDMTTTGSLCDNNSVKRKTCFFFSEKKRILWREVESRKWNYITNGLLHYCIT